MPLLQRRPSTKNSCITREFKTPRSLYPQMTPATSSCISSRSASTLADNIHNDQQCYSFSSTSTHDDGAAESRDPPGIPIPWLKTYKDTDIGVSEPFPDSVTGIPGSERSPSYFNTPDPSVITQLHPELTELSSPSNSLAVTNISLDRRSSPLPVLNSPRHASAPAIKRKHALFYITDSMVTLEVSRAFGIGCSMGSRYKSG